MLIMFVEIIVLVLAFWAAWLTIPRKKAFVSAEVFEYAYGLWSQSDVNLQVKPQIKPAPLFDWDSLMESKNMWFERLTRKSSHLIFFHLGQDIGLGSFIGKDSHEAILSLDALAQKVDRSSQRLVFTAEQEHAHNLIVFLHQNPGLRDVVAAVVCLEPKFDEEWMKDNFTHEQMDLEQNHSIPYLMLSSRPVLGEIEEPKNGWYSINLQSLSIVDERNLQLKRQEFLRPALWNILDLLLFQ